MCFHTSAMRKEDDMLLATMQNFALSIDNISNIHYDINASNRLMRRELTDPLSTCKGWKQRPYGQPGQLPSAGNAARLIARKCKFYELAAS